MTRGYSQLKYYTKKGVIASCGCYQRELGEKVMLSTRAAKRIKVEQEKETLKTIGFTKITKRLITHLNAAERWTDISFDRSAGILALFALYFNTPKEIAEKTGLKIELVEDNLCIALEGVVTKNVNRTRLKGLLSLFKERKIVL